MTIRGIKKELLSLLLELGKNSHPNEFAALLKEEEGVISELNLLPGTVTGSSSASIFFDMMPLDTHLAGSAHSHPNGVLRPSSADVNFFPRAGNTTSSSAPRIMRMIGNALLRTASPANLRWSHDPPARRCHRHLRHPPPGAPLLPFRVKETRRRVSG